MPSATTPSKMEPVSPLQPGNESSEQLEKYSISLVVCRSDDCDYPEKLLTDISSIGHLAASFREAGSFEVKITGNADSYKLAANILQKSGLTEILKTEWERSQ
jgi:hypothetical protein